MYLIKDILKNKMFNDGKEVCIIAWVKNNRANNKLGFLDINDGSVFKNLQVVYKKENLPNFDEIKSYRTYSAIEIKGNIKITPDKPQPLEIVATSISLLKDSDEDFLINNPKLTLDTLRNEAHLRPRTYLFQAIMRLRSALAFSIHEFMMKNDFLWVASPLLTTNDAEGAGETFTLEKIDGSEFFNQKAHLTVTGQLHAEAYAQAFGKVYTFGPTFRAEKSHTNRHLAEFWMIEPEMSFVDLTGLQNTIEALVKYSISYVLEHNLDEITYLNDKIDNTLLARLKNVVTNDFKRVSYQEAVDILSTAIEQNLFDFEDKEMFFGKDLASEHERYLVEHHYQSPVFLYNYPKQIKAFYMKQNDDELDTVAATDLLVPGIGELVGGSQREACFSKLKARCEDLNLPVESLQWYLDLRKYGYYMSSGFGIGFERLVMYVCGLSNIKDTIPFPRSHSQIGF
ncbi:asparagine--tRNA ligase [Ureaplasma canigenitalium]|uniref:asparagine--tRNA ligase n=1 Tax=Ureaplasma canigenitalium TaxID=42092 RepID=UPI0004E0BC3B|nr:asparagine--tRNA ligase [Ureaplasma canigenitalium]